MVCVVIVMMFLSGEGHVNQTRMHQSLLYHNDVSVISVHL